MTSNLYISELEIENDSKNNLLEDQELKEINDNFQLTNNSIRNDGKTLEKTKHNIIDYLIREETDYADLFKVEKYFRVVNISNSKKFNNYSKLIKRKKEEIDEVQELINKEIIENINLEKEDMIDLYRQEKEKIVKNINSIDHDMEIYQGMYETLYKKNVREFYMVDIF